MKHGYILFFMLILSSQIVFAACGDGILDPGEECDNGWGNGASCGAPPGGSCQYCTTGCCYDTEIGPPLPSGDPYGNHDGISCASTSGWACDPSDFSQPLV